MKYIFVCKINSRVLGNLNLLVALWILDIIMTLLWSVVDNESVALIVPAAEGSASGAAEDLTL